MANYIDPNGTKFWYEENGVGDLLMMLHPGGAGVDSRAFGPNLGLAQQFHLFLMDRRAHGRTADTDGEITFELMADDTINFIEQVIGKPTKLVGYSDGGVVALLVAQKKPELVERLVCIASVFHASGWENGGVLKPGKNPPQFLVDSYAEISPDGADHYPVVVKKLNKMHINSPSLTSDDLKNIKVRTLIMVGDDDEVYLEHALNFYRSLPNGELAVVPGTSHGLLPEKPELCNKIILDFLSRDPVQTFAPIRRA